MRPAVTSTRPLACSPASCRRSSASSSSSRARAGRVARSARPRSRRRSLTATPLLVTANGPSVLNKMLYASLSYDPDADFTPISLISDVPQVFIVNPKSPVADLKGLVALAKEKKDALTIGHPGVGTGAHLTAIWFANLAGINVIPVAYTRCAADRHGGARRRDRRRPAGLYPAGPFREGDRRHLRRACRFSTGCADRPRKRRRLWHRGPSRRWPRRPARRPKSSPG